MRLLKPHRLRAQSSQPRDVFKLLFRVLCPTFCLHERMRLVSIPCDKTYFVNRRIRMTEAISHDVALRTVPLDVSWPWEALAPK